jgi:hypothetical protein
VILLLAAPFLAAASLYDRWQRMRLRRAFLARWTASGKDLLLVYSNSPHWKAYIESNWLPALEARAVVLNWSERTTWPNRYPLEGAVFRRWAGDTEFNPIAIIFPARGTVQVIRFWRAFREYTHGRGGPLREAERQLTDTLGLPLPVGA